VIIRARWMHVALLMYVDDEDGLKGEADKE
jgi:hypothetical protein